MGARTPEQCDHLFADHVNRGDLQALMSLYHPSCSLVQRDGSVATGHAAIRDVLGGLVAMKPRLRLEVVKVVRAGDDLAMVYNDWSMSARQPDGQPIEMAGRSVELVQRQPDGTWQFILDDPFAWG